MITDLLNSTVTTQQLLRTLLLRTLLGFLDVWLSTLSDSLQLQSLSPF